MSKILENLNKWEFNVFDVEEHTSYPLVAVTESALFSLHLQSTLNLNEVKLRNFLMAIQDAYVANPYHNYIHAADVTQTVYHLCTHGELFSSYNIGSLASLALIVAAAIHDVNHPGM